MDRINGAGTVDIGGGRRGFVDEDLGVGQEGTEVTALWLNMTQEEMIKVIETAGLVLNPADWTQLWQALQILGLSAGARSRRWTAVISMTLSSAPGAPAAGDTYLVPTGATGVWAAQVGKIAEWNGTAWYCFTPVDGHGISLPDGRIFERIGGAYVEKLALDVQSGKWSYVNAGGTVNAVTAMLVPAPAALIVGMRVYVKLAGPTTGAMTLNVNGLGAQSVVLPDGSAVQAGTGTAGMIVYFEWDGANWQLNLPLSPQALRSQVAPALRVNKTADQSMSINVETLCSFDQVVFDNLGDLGTWNGSDTLTIGEKGAGTWLINGHAGCYQTTSASAHANRIKVNATKIAETFMTTNNVAGATAGPMAVLYKLVPGDQIRFYGYVSPSATLQGMYANQGPFFAAAFLGK